MKWKITSLCLASILTFSACSGEKKASLPKAEQKNQEKDDKKKTVASKAEEKNTSKSEKFHRLLGEVSSSDKIYLSFKVSANIDRILVKPGERVKKGQELAKLYDDSFFLLYEGAKLDFEAMENALLQAERDFNIEKELREKDISSPIQFQDGELLYKKAVINRKISSTKMLSAKKAYENTRLVAPVDGVISRQLKYVGDLSTGGNEGGATFEMFSTREPEIYLRAPEALLLKLKIGEKFDIYFPSLKLKLPAKVIRTVPAISDKDRTFLVVASVLEKSSQIVPGLFAEGLVRESEQ